MAELEVSALSAKIDLQRKARLSDRCSIFSYEGVRRWLQEEPMPRVQNHAFSLPQDLVEGIAKPGLEDERKAY